MVVLGEEDPKLLKCIPIDSTSFVSYAPYQNLLISSTSASGLLELAQDSEASANVL